MASYQTACYYTLKTGSRSLQTLRSRQLAEAGLEEALWALNNRNFSGWTIASGVYTKSLTGFTYESSQVTGRINLTITNYDDANRNTTKPTITAVGIIQNTDGTSVTRTLSAGTGYSSTAATGRAPILSNALAANSTSGSVNLTSGGMTIDSYNSSLGSYNSSTNSGYAAVVAGSSVTLANGTQVKGYVATPPSSSAVVLSTGSTAKLTGPSTSGTVKIDASRESTSPNQIVADVPTPSGAGTTLNEPTGTVHLGTAGGSTTTYYATLGGTSGWAGWYYLSSGTLQVDGPVILVIPGNLYINGSGSIVIKSGGSLQILVSGNAYIYYNGIDNQTHLPKNLAIINTNSSYVGNSVQVWTPTKFYGAIYAPKADITLWGYSSASELFGSLVGNNITVYPYSSTALPLHYDVALRDAVFSGVGDTAQPYAVSNITDTF
ncbi:MAG TPA: hypothetical protein VG838_08260 [Opitutaceae bacterium]|nr:hypothetical protein [Opitutaceae bacterium]